MSALLLAAATVAASFTPPSFTSDTLRQLVQEAGTASAVLDAQVDSKGRISNCKVIASSGETGALCGLAETLRIEPASVLGEPVYGVVRQAVGTKAQEPSDVEVQVNQLPAGQKTLRVEATVMVAATGKPQACNAGEAPAGYGDVACAQVSAITFGSLKDDDGRPVRYVRTVVVDFLAPA
jgi:hypothetical protein